MWGVSALEDALDGIGWPGRGVTYESVGADERRKFERSFKELLVLQQESVCHPVRGVCLDLVGLILTDRSFTRAIKIVDSTPVKLRSVLSFDDEIENGLYPIVAMVGPVRQRFAFHFEGDRGTNRLDKVCSTSAAHSKSCTTRMLIDSVGRL